MVKSIFLVIALSIFLVGCGDKDEATNVPDNAPIEEETTNNSNTTNNTADTSYNFTQFNLEVDYPNNQKYDVEYENETTGSEAKIEDQVNNNVVQGNEAINQLVPIFETLKFDNTTSDEDVLNQVIEAFNISNDYIEIELDVQFADGIEKEYRKMQ